MTAYSWPQASQGKLKMLALIQQHFKQTLTGGLTHLLIPPVNPVGQMTTITDAQDMNKHLLNYSLDHFKQVHGTPFTTAPLKDLLG